jgi:hypothetical protein
MSKTKKKNSSDETQSTLEKCFLDIQELKENLKIKDEIIIDQAGTIELLKKRLNLEKEENFATQETILSLTPGVIALERENKNLKSFKNCFDKTVYPNDKTIFDAAMERQKSMQHHRQTRYSFKSALEDELIEKKIKYSQNSLEEMDIRFRSHRFKKNKKHK